MTHPLADADALRLHQLRLRGFQPAPDEGAWAELVTSGFVVVERGRVRLTPEGTARTPWWARRRPARTPSRPPRPRTSAFVPLNQRLLKVCHDWQIARGGIPNDHSDPAYDDRVVDRLHGVDAGARRILGDLVPFVPRFAGYAVGFDDALARLATGKREWFASPACDSYHTVWMQFHEDLLLATGRSRADEETALTHAPRSATSGRNAVHTSSTWRSSRSSGMPAMLVQKKVSSNGMRSTTPRRKSAACSGVSTMKNAPASPMPEPTARICSGSTGDGTGWSVPSTMYRP